MDAQKIRIKITQEKNQKFYNISKDTIITLDFEEYLLGCVAAEIGEAPLEAAKAQAIAARTYAWRTVKKSGYLGDTGSSGQAFQGERINNSAYSTTHQGVRATAGTILTYKNQVVDAFFSASNGGRTVSSEERWGGKRDYLIAKDDPYDVGTKKGHGVGLSQRGATARAKAGHDYKAILEFYYPETMLTANYGLAPQQTSGDISIMTNEEKVLVWAKDQVGHPYIYGGNQTCTVKYRKARAEQYPQYASSIYKYCQQLNNKKTSCKGCQWTKNGDGIGQTAYDCAQFVRFALKQIGISLPSGATSQWNSSNWVEKGKLSNAPKDKLLVVFREDSDGKKGHVGLLYQGVSYHAQGHSSGVVANNYTKWTHYAIAKGMYDGTIEPPEVINMLYQVKVVSTSSSLNFRADTSTKSTRLALIPPQTILDVVEETNDEWLKVIYNNETGYVMTEFVEKIDEETDEPDTPKYWYIKLRCNNEQEALAYQELLTKLAAAEAVEE